MKEKYNDDVVPTPTQKYNHDGVMIPHAVAHNITRRCLFTSYAFLMRDLKERSEDLARELTSEEVAHSTMLIDHFATVIKFYGDEE
jgi:hypothetical protein